MRYAPEHKQETRAKLLSEAGRQLRSAGPGGVGVAGIMQGLGLTHGGFYAHFDSKDALVAEAIAAMFAEARANFERRAIGETPEARLSNYIGFYLSAAHRDARDRGCPIAALGSEAPRLPGPAREHFSTGLSGLTTRLAELLREHGCTDPMADAGSMIAELVGALALARATEDAAQSDALLANSAAAIRRRLGLAAATTGAGA